MLLNIVGFGLDRAQTERVSGHAEGGGGLGLAVALRVLCATELLGRDRFDVAGLRDPSYSWCLSVNQISVLVGADTGLRAHSSMTTPIA